MLNAEKAPSVPDDIEEAIEPEDDEFDDTDEDDEEDDDDDEEEVEVGDDTSTF